MSKYPVCIHNLKIHSPTWIFTQHRSMSQPEFKDCVLFSLNLNFLPVSALITRISSVFFSILERHDVGNCCRCKFYCVQYVWSLSDRQECDQVFACAVHVCHCIYICEQMGRSWQPCRRSSSLLWLRVCVCVRVCLQHQLLNVACP